MNKQQTHYIIYEDISTRSEPNHVIEANLWLHEKTKNKKCFSQDVLNTRNTKITKSTLGGYNNKISSFNLQLTCQKTPSNVNYPNKGAYIVFYQGTNLSGKSVIFGTTWANPSKIVTDLSKYEFWDLSNGKRRNWNDQICSYQFILTTAMPSNYQ
ncbi:MAG: hypothetical protein LUH10_02975 [Tannerellaceae bacterium]|nr:hypothetical protein [Tannerellaceae bacterium]